MKYPDPQIALNLHQALCKAIESKQGKFTIPTGEHLIMGTLLPERFCHITNNDHGLKRILFDVDGASDLVIDGAGSRWVFFGEVLPVRIGFSSNIVLKNLTIDWFRPFYSQGEITECGLKFVEIKCDPVLYPLRVDQGRLVAHDGNGWQTDVLWNLLPFDVVRGEVSSQYENWHLNRWHRASELGKGHFRIEADFQEHYKPGTPVVLMHGNRVAPGVWIEESAGVTLENVNLHHAPAMGVVAQCSSDITLDRVRVIPSGDRLFSTWVDATHFVDCHGHTLITGCELRGQFDDASNIHATFYKVVGQPSTRTARIQTIHPQRYGRCAIKSGDGVAIHRHADMATLLITRCLSVTALNEEINDLCFEDELPVDEGLILRRYEPSAANSVTVRDSHFGANRGRGLLLNMEQRMIVENNHFHVSGRAIESIPDANYWWEAGPFESLTIRGNTFEDCNFGPCGDTLIHVGPELPDGSDPRKGAFQNGLPHIVSSAPAKVLRNLVVENNVIIYHRSKILNADGIDGLIFQNNTLLPSKNYKTQESGPHYIIGANTENIHIQDHMNGGPST